MIAQVVCARKKSLRFRFQLDVSSRGHFADLVREGGLVHVGPFADIDPAADLVSDELEATGL